MKKLLLLDLESIIRRNVKIDSTVELSNPVDTLMLNSLLKSKEYRLKRHGALEAKLANHWYFKFRGDDVLEQIFDVCGSVYEDATLLEGCIPFLSCAKEAGLLIALCGEGSIPSLEYIMYKFNLDEFIDYTITGQQVGETLPSDKMYRMIQIFADVEASDCISFQQSIEGMEASSRAGIDYVRIYKPDYLINSSTLDKRALALIKDFSDPILKELVGK